MKKTPIVAEIYMCPECERQLSKRRMSKDVLLCYCQNCQSEYRFHLNAQSGRYVFQVEKDETKPFTSIDAVEEVDGTYHVTATTTEPKKRGPGRPRKQATDAESQVS